MKTLAAALSALGIHGVVSHTVAQRTHEISVRLALGAQSGDVLRMAHAQGMKLSVVGIALGSALAAHLT